jgi:hypothetical protein
MEIAHPHFQRTQEPSGAASPVPTGPLGHVCPCQVLSLLAVASHLARSSPHRTSCPPTTSNHPPTHPLFTRLLPVALIRVNSSILFLSLSCYVSSPAFCAPPPLLMAPWPSPNTDHSHGFGRALLVSHLILFISTDFPGSGFGIRGSLSTSPRARLYSFPRPGDASDSPGHCSSSESQ